MNRLSAGFGAAQIMALAALGDDGVEEVVMGLFATTAPHLSTGCLESIEAVVSSVLSGRRVGVSGSVCRVT